MRYSQNTVIALAVHTLGWVFLISELLAHVIGLPEPKTKLKLDLFGMKVIRNIRLINIIWRAGFCQNKVVTSL